jgi:hypothetical protein
MNATMTSASTLPHTFGVLLALVLALPIFDIAVDTAMATEHS